MTILGLTLAGATIIGSIFFPPLYKAQKPEAVEAIKIGEYVQKIEGNKYKIGLVGGCSPLFFSLKIDNINRIEAFREQSREQYRKSVQSIKPEILIVDKSKEEVPSYFENYSELKSFKYFSVLALKSWSR